MMILNFDNGKNNIIFVGQGLLLQGVYKQGLLQERQGLQGEQRRRQNIQAQGQQG